MYGGIGDTARGRRKRAEGAGVNYRGLVVRRETIWLPETDTDPNKRTENSGRVVFSVVLSKKKISEMPIHAESRSISEARRTQRGYTAG